MSDERSTRLGGGPSRGDVGTIVPEVWDFMVDDIGIQTVIDVGCGDCEALLYFMYRGCDGVGVDGLDSKKHPGLVRVHDYNEGPLLTGRKYDLCWSAEFVEHVDECFRDNFLATFKEAHWLAMTHAVPGQGGHHHVNCQDQDYWTKVLADNGFKIELAYSQELRAMVLSHHGMYVRNTLLICENMRWTTK